MPLAALAAAVDALVVDDPLHHADGTSLEELHRQLARLQGVVARAAAAFEAAGAFRDEGAPDAATWLTVRCRLPRPEDLGKIALDPIAGAIVRRELGRLEDELFRADWQEASDRLGREPTHTPGSLLPYLDEALVERVVFAPPARIEVSATVRLFSGATRRAIELRDRSCAHPFCERPASLCEVDHVVPWHEGGETTQENGRLRCGYRNRLRNAPMRGRPPPAA